MAEQEATEKAPDEGSIEWYLHYSGGFVRDMVHTIQHADGSNRARLRRAFPQMVAAFEMHSWTDAPPGFEPRYDADLPKGEAAS